MLGLLEEDGVEGAILGLHMKDAARFGTISKNTAGELVSFNEKKPGAGTISAGVYLIRDAALAKFPKRSPLSFETDVFPEMIARRARLKVFETSAPFLDIGTPESSAAGNPIYTATSKLVCRWLETNSCTVTLCSGERMTVVIPTRKIRPTRTSLLYSLVGIANPCFSSRLVFLKFKFCFSSNGCRTIT